MSQRQSCEAVVATAQTILRLLSSDRNSDAMVKAIEGRRHRRGVLAFTKLKEQLRLGVSMSGHS